VDRRLEPDFEEAYRVGSVTGEAWEQFGNVRALGFDGVRLYKRQKYLPLTVFRRRSP